MDLRVIAVHLSVVVMLASGMVLRRSLGSWPCWLSAFVFSALVEVLWSWRGLPRDTGIVSLFEMMTLPTMLLILARRQIVPGLRRGEWSEEERRRWLTRQALATTPFGHTTNRLRLR